MAASGGETVVLAFTKLLHDVLKSFGFPMNDNGVIAIVVIVVMLWVLVILGRRMMAVSEREEP